MIRKLVEYTLEERKRIDHQAREPGACTAAEAMANIKARQCVRDMTMAVRAAIQHPDDDDCRALRTEILLLLADHLR